MTRQQQDEGELNLPFPSFTCLYDYTPAHLCPLGELQQLGHGELHLALLGPAGLGAGGRGGGGQGRSGRRGLGRSLDQAGLHGAGSGPGGTWEQQNSEELLMSWVLLGQNPIPQESTEQTRERTSEPQTCLRLPGWVAAAGPPATGTPGVAVWSGERYDTTFCNRGEKESNLVAVATARTHEEHLRKRGRCDEEKLRGRERERAPLGVRPSVWRRAG